MANLNVAPPEMLLGKEFYLPDRIGRGPLQGFVQRNYHPIGIIIYIMGEFL